MTTGLARGSPAIGIIPLFSKCLSNNHYMLDTILDAGYKVSQCATELTLGRDRWGRKQNKWFIE